MKHKLLHVKSLVAVALCAIMSLSFVGCSDDDDEGAGDELKSIIVGTWAQDGDNDILVVNANGTGVIYDSPELYEQKKDGASFTWTYKDGWIKAGIAGVQEEELRAKSVSKNKIVWQRYAIASEDYDPSEDEWDGHDAFGYYDYWTWERYNK